MGSTTGKRPRSGKLRDPVFLFMVVAMVLAVTSSVVLRTIARHAGPASASAAEPFDDSSPDSLPPLPKTAAHSARR